MFGKILFVNWKAARFGLLPFIMAAFALPLLSVRFAHIVSGVSESSAVLGADLLEVASTFAPAYPALAFVLGTVLALLIWNWDHRGDHVYPLSLPLQRWKYVLYKLGAGGVLLLIPVAVLWFGSLLAVSVIEIPDGLRAFPTTLSFRFLLASLISFAVFFALAAGTMRTAVILLIAWVLLVYLGETAPPILGRLLDMPNLANFRFLDWTLNAVTTWPGPFEVYLGNWMLIDV